jgi:hypothetical protein
MRDSNYLKTSYGEVTPWMEGFGTLGGAPDCYSHGCKVDPPLKTVVDCAATTCIASPLYYDTVNYRYNQQNTGTKTKFARTVSLTTISPTEILVSVTVTWENHGARSLVLTEYLRNWL